MIKVLEKYCPWVILVACLGVGCLVRFYNIQLNELFFYDEGMYLAFNRRLIQTADRLPDVNFETFLKINSILITTAHATAKALWFYLCSSRVWFASFESFSSIRVLSAMASLLTLPVTFWCAYQLFRSRVIAGLSVCLLALVPSHVFYGRLAMQEALSGLCFALGMAFYFKARTCRWYWILLSGVSFAAVYYSNYRMLIIPFLLAALEFFFAFPKFKQLNIRRYIWVTVVFLVCVFGGGALNDGAGTIATFKWVFYQMGEASVNRFDWFNFLSYPYMMSRLDGFFYAVLFFSSMLLVVLKKREALPIFVWVLMYMLMFSVSAEKGARYLNVMLPFISIVCAYNLKQWWTIAQNSYQQAAVIGWTFLIVIVMLSKSYSIMSYEGGHQEAVQMILSRVPQAGILSTQPVVQQLYHPNPKQIRPAPHEFKQLLAYYKSGYQFVILDPQAFISWTKSDERFVKPLSDYLEILWTRVTPLERYQFLNADMMDRFVLDHNHNLKQSIHFLNTQENDGEIRIYHIGMLLKQLNPNLKL